MIELKITAENVADLKLQLEDMLTELTGNYLKVDKEGITIRGGNVELKGKSKKAQTDEVVEAPQENTEEEAQEESSESYTKEQAIQLAGVLLKDHKDKRQAFKDMLAEMGLSKASDIEGDQIQEFATKVKALMEG